MIDLIAAALIAAPPSGQCAEGLNPTSQEAQVRLMLGEGVLDFTRELTRQIAEMPPLTDARLTVFTREQQLTSLSPSPFQDPLIEDEGLFALSIKPEESIFEGKYSSRITYPLDYHSATLGNTSHNLQLLNILGAHASFIASNIDVERLQSTIDNHPELEGYTFGRDDAQVHFTELMKTIVTVSAALTADHDLSSRPVTEVLEDIWLPKAPVRFSTMDILAMHFPPAIIGRLLPVYRLKHPTYIAEDGSIQIHEEFLSRLRHIRTVWNEKEEAKGRKPYETGRGCPMARCFDGEGETPITQLLTAILNRI